LIRSEEVAGSDHPGIEIEMGVDAQIFPYGKGIPSPAIALV